jgi:hypothetical protein
MGQHISEGFPIAVNNNKIYVTLPNGDYPISIYLVTQSDHKHEIRISVIHPALNDFLTEFL